VKHLVFTNTPAHVHLYRHAVEKLEDRGHEVRILARDYGCTVDLLDWYELPYTVYGRCGTSVGSLLRRLPGHFLRIARTVRAYDPDLVFGMGAYAAHAGLLSRTPVVLVLDSEPTSVDLALSRPFARAVLTPAAFRKHLGRNHYVFSGFMESAYLHPEVYSPAHAVDLRAELGLDDDERYAIVRFNAFGSHHDIGVEGFTPTQRAELVSELADHVTVLVSDEGGDLDLSSLPARRFDTHPALLHDALAEADLLVADTQTVVTEAALLGTPAIRSNSFVGDDDMGNFLDLEQHGLIYNFTEFEEVLECARGLLADESTAAEWSARRDEYVEGMVNLTDLIVNVATNPDAIDAVPGLSRRGEVDPPTPDALSEPDA